MNECVFNFINGIVVGLLHYRSKKAFDGFNQKIKEVQNPNVTDKVDLVIDREEADNFFSKCSPYDYDNLMTNKLLLKSDDDSAPKRIFDNKKYICMTYDIGKRMRNEFKTGFRKSEIQYIEEQALRMQKWVFALAEFNVILSYRTIDRQGFVLIAEVMDGENKFDKAMRIVQIVYEYLGFNVGDSYVGFVPEMKYSFTTDICPMSFDNYYMFGYIDKSGKYFGSFDCSKKLGNAEDILVNEFEIEKRGDIHDVQFKFEYANEMLWFDEQKYDVVKNTGLEITIKGGIKNESDWKQPVRQLQYAEEGIQVVYGNSELKDNKVSDNEIDALKTAFPDDDNIFTIVNKEGSHKPCNVSKMRSISEQYDNSSIMESPIFYFGGYMKDVEVKRGKKIKVEPKFFQSMYVLFRIKKPQDDDILKNFVRSNKTLSGKLVCYFKCKDTDDDLYILFKIGSKTAKYYDEWLKISHILDDSSINYYDYTSSEECICTTPIYSTLDFA